MLFQSEQTTFTTGLKQLIKRPDQLEVMSLADRFTG